MDEMKRFGWKEMSIVRMKESTLSFERGDRLATVVVAPSSQSKTVVVLTMAPKTKGAATAAKAIAATPSTMKPATTIKSQTKTK